MGGGILQVVDGGGVGVLDRIGGSNARWVGGMHTYIRAHNRK